MRGFLQDVTKSMETELKIKNIDAATSQIYHAIYTLDLDRNYMEQLVGNIQMYEEVGVAGVASEKFELICKTFVAEDYRDRVRKFFDLATLRERLREKLYVSCEYPNKEGVWRRATFNCAEEKYAGRSAAGCLCNAGD